MAAVYLVAARTALKGLVPGRWLLAQGRQTPAVCQCFQLHAAQSRPLHVASAASLCSSKTEPQRSTQPHSTAGTHTEDRRAREEEEEYDGPDYFPRKSAKNPMMVIVYAWMICVPVSIISFYLVKRGVDKNRVKQMKIRQRMKMSNEGIYEGSRYRRSAEDVQVTTEGATLALQPKN